MFNNEHVILRLKARLVSSHGEYPDCIADIVLTEKNLYAVEDNFDGTFTHHIEVPIEEIVEIGPYTDERTQWESDKPDNPLYGKELATQRLLSTMRFGRVGVGLKKKRERYMRVALQPDPKAGSSRLIFFAECSEKPEKMGRALSAYRKRS